jgi:hypothetical protein
MIVVNFGGGTNSTGLLIGAVERGLRPDLVVFADTGSEMPHTYTHLEAVASWLEAQGLRRIEVVRWVRRDGRFVALHEQCLERSELPSKAYGFSGCTTKWKQQPVDRWLRQHPEVLAEHAAGRQVERWIGYDADEPQRAKRMAEKNPDPHLWTWRAPLVDWDWGRDECVEAIARAGLEQPGKSSCFMCPSMRKAEVEALAARYPDKLAVALDIERRAVTRSGDEREGSSIVGLGRRFAWADVVKGLPVVQGPTDVACGCYDGDD